ncbi:hypothetical protein AFI02nite_14160 [Aliivibrio fischeri]|uniref:Uncharacterized protein n=1 Tax=Aliivibrio fischeri TaxID=668 RepID=A0A510UJ60_ALIFS|nr:hypothetical protein AFI02nite_14160 [Aliivibrio fischeri]
MLFYYHNLKASQLLNASILESIGGAKKAKITVAITNIADSDKFEKSVSFIAEPNERLIRTLAKSTLYISSNRR